MVFLLVAVLAGSPAAVAQQPDRQTAPSSQDAGVDVDELPISLVRIRRGLAALPDVPPDARLHLDYYVDVYGTLPHTVLFDAVDLDPTGPVVYGGMTHSEFLRVVTPQEFSSPVANLSGLAFGASSWAVRRASERRQEEIEARIAEERRLLEAQRQRELDERRRQEASAPDGQPPPP